MSNNSNKEFSRFLKGFGYTNPKISGQGKFRYEVNFSSEKTEPKVPIDFYFSTSDSDIFQIQERIWNENELNSFILISKQKTEIFNAKVKPQPHNPNYGKIESFDYGLENQNNNIPEVLRKEKLDVGYFFDFVIEKKKKNREQEVDKHLLLNLIALQQDLLKIHHDNHTTNLLILRCLFIKYLEDKGIYDSGYLVDILNQSNSNKLLKAFNEISKINGDVFKYDSFSKNSIRSEYLSPLASFFTFDYLSGQGLLFPYKFNYIPIQLISNVYEAFLSNAKKKGKGIYYTPKFVVDFMLSQTLIPKLKRNKRVSILDPACGSGAFLVEGFKAIVKRNKAELNFEEKIEILKNQIFGIDNDRQALQIATFSLYLALLEDLDVDFIKNKIERQSPILPSLIGINLIHGNSLTDNIFKNKTFDCIAANPPWGSVPNDEEGENIKERKAIGGKGIEGKIFEYKNVSDFQRSQAFLLRVKKWSSSKTVFGLIVNNSIFLNEKAEDFRKDFLKEYRLDSFFELSKLNKILFRKRKIGKVNGKAIEIGATEPCAALIFDTKNNENNTVSYVSPRLDLYSEFLLLIRYSDYDIKNEKQTSFLNDDILWRVFVNGNWDDYQLIRNQISKKEKSFSIICRSGIQPKKNMKSLGNPDYKLIIEPKNFERYFVTENENLGQFNMNQKLHRDREESHPILFEGERIILPIRPTAKHLFKFNAARINESQVFKHDIVCLKIKYQDNYLKDIRPLLSLINSKFIGYFFYHYSVQWGKGDLKRSTFRNSDIEDLPLPSLLKNSTYRKELAVLVKKIEKEKKNPFSQKIELLEKQIDKLVFDLYELTEFEKSIIKEFYDINVHRKEENANKVRPSDLKAYFNKFKEIFELVLNENLTIDATYKISNNIGAFMVFQIKEKQLANDELVQNSLSDVEVFHAMKKAQMEDAFYSNKLNEQKTKIYETERFFMIKSNFYKDWTIRQAIKDANEEVKILSQEATVE